MNVDLEDTVRTVRKGQSMVAVVRLAKHVLQTLHQVGGLEVDYSILVVVVDPDQDFRNKRYSGFEAEASVAAVSASPDMETIAAAAEVAASSALAVRMLLDSLVIQEANR